MLRASRSYRRIDRSAYRRSAKLSRQGSCPPSQCCRSRLRGSSCGRNSIRENTCHGATGGGAEGRQSAHAARHHRDSCTDVRRGPSGWAAVPARTHSDGSAPRPPSEAWSAASGPAPEEHSGPWRPLARLTDALGRVQNHAVSRLVPWLGEDRRLPPRVAALFLLLRGNRTRMLLFLAGMAFGQVLALALRPLRIRSPGSLEIWVRPDCHPAGDRCGESGCRSPPCPAAAVLAGRNRSSQSGDGQSGRVPVVFPGGRLCLHEQAAEPTRACLSATSSAAPVADCRGNPRGRRGSRYWLRLRSAAGLARSLRHGEVRRPVWGQVRGLARGTRRRSRVQPGGTRLARSWSRILGQGLEVPESARSKAGPAWIWGRALPRPGCTSDTCAFLPSRSVGRKRCSRRYLLGVGSGHHFSCGETDLPPE